MKSEKYIPSTEEIKKAEERLTPEQKLQSDAREEGFHIGFEEGQKIVINSQTALEKRENIGKVKHEFTMTVGNKVAQKIVNFIRTEATNNNVTVRFADIPGPLETVVKVYFEGEQKTVLKTIANIMKTLESWGKSTQDFLDLLGKY